MNARLLLLLAAIGISGCQPPTSTEVPSIAFTSALIIDPATGHIINDGIILVRNGRVAAIGAKPDVELPAGTSILDLGGKYVVPGFINTHGHVGDVKGIDGGKYSAENIIDNLRLYASYGITTVVSLGGDRKEAEPLRAVRDSLPVNHARLYIAGDIITGSTPAEAVAMVDSNHQMGVDFIKIRVDDNLGTAKKMSKEIYRAIIARAHELGYRVATHMYYLDDATNLLKSGTDFMAHSVRDQAVDEEFILLMKERKVCYCPTLTRELSTYVYSDTADFFSDPFFTRFYDTAVTKPLMDPARQKQVSENRNAQIYRQQLPVAMTNLKTLGDKSIPIAFGTDSGIPTRFIGYFEHLEMAMMAEAGLTPTQIIRSATIDAAKCLGLEDVGSLSTGHWADFVVVAQNPLDDIRNMRTIDAVYIAGNKLETRR